MIRKEWANHIVRTRQSFKFLLVSTKYDPEKVFKPVGTESTEDLWKDSFKNGKYAQEDMDLLH